LHDRRKKAHKSLATHSQWVSLSRYLTTVAQDYSKNWSAELADRFMFLKQQSHLSFS
jgi:hypothetical protein